MVKVSCILFLLKKCSKICERRMKSNSALLDGKKLSVITMDAMNTLIRLKQPPGDTYADFAKRAGLNCNGDELTKAFRKNFKKLSKEKLCYGFRKGGEVAWWTELVKNCFVDVGMEGAEIDSLALELFDYYESIDPWCLVNEQIYSHLSELQRRGLQLGVISNFDKRLKSILDALNLSPFFKMIFLSGEIGIEKPNRQIFEKAVKFFKITSTEEMLHVGDDEDKDFNGARNAGVRAVLLTSGKMLYDKKYMISSLKDIIDRLE